MTFQAIIKRTTTIREAVRLMGSQPDNRFIAGIAVMVDDSGKVTGVVTDGDVRRGLSRDVSVDAPVEVIAKFDPVTVDYRLNHKMMRQAVMEKARQRGTDYRKYDKLILIDEAGRLKDVVRLVDILSTLMPRFYQIARLRVGETIFPDSEVLRVDLDGVGSGDLIENDTIFRAAAASDSWFWLSGGGTLLLNGRYLPVVRRSADARVNPGKFSLFTGRADNEEERANPALLVRELFEELLLYEGNTLLVPQFSGLESIISAAHAAMREAGIIIEKVGRSLPLTPVRLADRPVRILQGGVEREHRLTWTKAINNDVNVLFLFAAECDLAVLRARDGEYPYGNDGVTPASRAIYLYDLVTGSVRPLSEIGEAYALPEAEMTAPLLFLLELCRQASR
jgi:CBS domain-containing protein